MNDNTISKLLRNGEGLSVEFKRDMPENAIKVIKTACAFANCCGGRIVIGVDDDGTVVGVDEFGAFGLADRIVDQISNACEPQIPVSSEVATLEGKSVIVLTVQMGLHVPYYVKSLTKEHGAFVRVGATSRVADEDTIKELELVGRGRSFDSMTCRGLTTSNAEIERLCARMYRLARANCDSDAERRKIKKVTPAQLEDWGVLVRAGSRLLPSHAFALLTGARSFSAEVRCGCFRGTTRAFFADQKDLAGSVLDQLERAYEFVLSKLNCALQIVGTQSTNVYEIPPDAIRELIVNAVVHRLYVNPRAVSIMVAVYDDRVEVTSPGGLPHGISLEMMMTGHSRSRNRALALAFRYMRFIESWGSGIPRVQKMLLNRKLRPLMVEDNGSDMRFVIWRPGKINEQVAQKDAEVAQKQEQIAQKGVELAQKQEQVAQKLLETGCRHPAVPPAVSPAVPPAVPPAVLRLVGAFAQKGMGLSEMVSALGLKNREDVRDRFLKPALAAGVLEDDPTESKHSPNRKYYLTELGRSLQNHIQMNAVYTECKKTV